MEVETGGHLQFIQDFALRGLLKRGGGPVQQQRLGWGPRPPTTATPKHPKVLFPPAPRGVSSSSDYGYQMFVVMLTCSVYH